MELLGVAVKLGAPVDDSVVDAMVPEDSLENGTELVSVTVELGAFVDDSVGDAIVLDDSAENGTELLGVAVELGTSVDGVSLGVDDGGGLLLLGNGDEDVAGVTQDRSKKRYGLPRNDLKLPFRGAAYSKHSPSPYAKLPQVDLRKQRPEQAA